MYNERSVKSNCFNVKIEFLFFKGIKESGVSSQFEFEVPTILLQLDSFPQSPWFKVYEQTSLHVPPPWAVILNWRMAIV